MDYNKVLKFFTYKDILFLIVFIFILFTAKRTRIWHEIVKFIGLIIASFFSFHYYPYVSKLLRGKLGLLKDSHYDLISFLLIFLSIIWIISLINKVIKRFIVQEKYPWENLFSILLGTTRALFLISIIIFLFYLGQDKPRKYNLGMVDSYLKIIAPFTYVKMYEFSYGKFLPGTKLNVEVRRYYETR